MDNIESFRHADTIATDYASLLEERRQLDRKLNELREAAVAEFVERVMAEAEKLELDLPELLGARHERKQRRSINAPVRYRDPNNPDNTWTGRGRPPKWLQDLIDAGKDQDEFAAE